MSTPQPQPSDDDSSYPSSWKPSYVRERDEQAHEMELALAAMPPDEVAAMLARIEANRA